MEAFNECQLNPSHKACCEKTFITQQKGQPVIVPQAQPPPPIVLAQPVPIIPVSNNIQLQVSNIPTESVLVPTMNDLSLQDNVVVNNVNNNQIFNDPSAVVAAAPSNQQEQRFYSTEEQQLNSLEYQQQQQQQQFGSNFVDVSQQQLPSPTYIAQVE